MNQNGPMDGQITDADILSLINESPLVAETLRRIVAERERDEARSQLANLNGTTGTTGATVKDTEAIVEGG